MRSTLLSFVLVTTAALILAWGAQAKTPSKATPKTQKLTPKQESAAVKAARMLGTKTKQPAYKMPNGLVYIDVNAGKGAPAKSGQATVVHYTGWLVNGTEFDTSRKRGQPFTFQLGAGGVIQGWDIGVVGIKPGGVRKLIIPANLGYGSSDMGVIPPNSTLIFEVQLVKAY